MTKGRFAEEFKQEAVRQVVESNRSFSLSLYNKRLNDGDRPNPGVENVPL